jgi:ferritin-like protein
MSDAIRLELLDADGAIQEAAGEAGATRASFLKRVGVTGVGFVSAGVLFDGLLSPAQAAISTQNRSKKNDVKILNYALTLEYLEAEFYRQAVASGAITDPTLKSFAEVVAGHEAAHVAALRKALGRAAVKSPAFDFGDTVTNQDKFKATAQVLEDTGVAAYAGQGPNIFQKAVIVPALGIHSVEARHAAWIRFINGAVPAPEIVDKPKTEKAVLKAVTATGFIKG